MSELVRIGGRLFNLSYVTSIEPGLENGSSVVDVHIVKGRTVRLRGDDARAAVNLVESYSPFPPELPPDDGESRDDEEPDREIADEAYPDGVGAEAGWNPTR